MLRILVRTLVILAGAAAVCGVLYLAVGSAPGSLPDQRVRPGDAAFADDGFRRGQGGWDDRRARRGEHHARQEASIGRGMVGALGSALQIGLVGAAVVGMQTRGRRRQASRKN